MLDHGEQEHDGLYHSKHRYFLHRYKYWIVGIVSILLIVAIVLTAVLVTKEHKKNQIITNNGLSLDNILSHLNQLQTIADNNGGTRVIGTPGFTASTEYVVGQLRSFGYQPKVQYFVVPWPIDIAAPKLTQTSPEYIDFSYGFDFDYMGEFFGSYNITANISVVGYGCTTEDFTGFQPGNIAIISRGNCTPSEQITLAQNNKATAIVIYNEGDTADRTDIFYGDLGPNVSVPVFSASYKVGLFLGKSSESVVHLSCNRILFMINTSNIIAETAGGRSDRVIVVGSHLDSVPWGPGINDNGSGTAMNLEVARLISLSSSDKIVNKVRFCWWGGEEEGLLGAYFYLNNLNATNSSALHDIVANLNYDMIASPNYIRGIYNGTSDKAGPGSGVIQSLYEDWMVSSNLPFELVAFDGRSDYGPFLEYGIPAGGLDAGADGVKTSSQQKLFGGLTNVIHDPCYHQACDTFSNLNTEILNQLSQAAAYTLQVLSSAPDLQLFLSGK